jgi:hypothetical protein
MTPRRPRPRPDRWSSSHERGRALAARRIDEPLEPADEAWLDAHLAECPRCAAIADEYAGQHAALRDLAAGSAPQPPRDLWARTAAAIEGDAARRRSASRRSGRTRRPSPLPLGVLSGALVAVVVIGASLLAQGPRIEPPPVANATGTPLATRTAEAPGATPLIVAAGDVNWLRQDRTGGFGLYVARIGQVCPLVERSACAPLDEQQRGEISNVEAPGTVVLSPKTDQLVVVDDDSDGRGGTVYVVPVATPPGPLVSAEPTRSPALTPSAPTSPSPPESTTPTPPSTTPTPPVTPTPTGSIGPFVTPLPSPDPSPDGSLAIASDVRLVGDSAAYSADGEWFAFSAEPADGSLGPDVYVWHLGDATAHPLTTDHRSVLAAWFGDQLLVSRVVPDAEPTASGSPSPAASARSTGSPLPTPATATGLHAETLLIDPRTGVETVLDQVPYWLPTVDPTGTLAVYWEGTLVADESGTEWRPDGGRLVLGLWPVEIAAPVADPEAAPGPSAPPPSARASSSPRATASVAPTGSPMPRATPGQGKFARPSFGAGLGPGSPGASPSAAPGLPGVTPEPTGQTLAEGPILDWDARWDPSGRHLALWIADPADPSIGRLSLFVIDPVSGRFDPDRRLLRNQPALPGFSLADGRLAWVTPPGQDGQASRVQVLAWTGDEVGSIETQGSAESILIIR